MNADCIEFVSAMETLAIVGCAMSLPFSVRYEREQLILSQYSITLIAKHYSPTLRTARKASWGMSTWPMRFMRFLPSFCLLRSFFLREMSPP